MICRQLCGVLFGLCCLITLTCQAKDLGTIGQVWPIAEEDFLTFIYQRLNQMQADGSLAEAEKKTQAQVRQHTYRPTPVTWLTTTTDPTVRYYDPTFTVPHTITNLQGQVIARQGKKVNPLKTVPFNETLWFINADDSHQIQWLKASLPHFHTNKIILTGGDIRAAAKALNQRVYFDQDGSIARKLGLVHIPDRVTRDGLRLRITEVSVNALPGGTS